MIRSLLHLHRHCSSALLAAALLFCLSTAAIPQSGGRLPHPREVVRARVLTSSNEIPRGAEFQIAVVAEIRDGFHINSNRPLEDYLIPTSVNAQLPPGLRLVSAEFPSGLLRKFTFSPNQLSVYEGEATLVITLSTAPDAPVGPLKIPLALRYQPCTNEICLPPATQDLSAEITLLSATPRGAPKPRSFKPSLKPPAKKH